jgi:hypothetical protein
MSDSWTEVTVADIKPGDRVRFRGSEFEVARVDVPFLGMDSMGCLIEDTPSRWHAYPGQLSGAIEVLRGG